jgi:hypothetical protein
MKFKNSLLCVTICFTIFYFYSIEIEAQQFAEVPNINSSVVIDGIADNLWNNLEEHPITFLIDGTDYPDTADCSGYFKAFWNRDTLYVLIFALDNTLYTANPIVYFNDGFEIYLNIDHTKDTVYTDHCYQFRFIPGSTDISGRWGLDVWVPPTVDFAINVIEDTSRTIEAVFPIVQLGKETSISAGDSIGFEIEILDNDGSGRDHVLSWNQNDHMAWFNPTKMGTISFTDNTINRINNLQSPDISIYPNPFVNSLFINSQFPIEATSIYSIQGQLLNIQTGLLSTNITLNMNKYSPGPYIIKLKLENGTCLNYKIFKSNIE